VYHRAHHTSSGVALSPRRSARAATDDVRSTILRAAERCIQRYGIRKTTMDDIAREVRMSRPSVYRYFADREDLLLALLSEHSRALTERARRFIDQHPSVEDGLVEGLLYIADHGHRDEFARLLVSMDDSAFGQRLASTDTSATLTGEFWDPFLDAAEERGELRPGLDRHDMHVWLGHVGLLLMGLLTREPKSDPAKLRDLLRSFVVPAFVTAPRSGKPAKAARSVMKATRPRRVTANAKHVPVLPGVRTTHGAQKKKPSATDTELAELRARIEQLEAEKQP
jgi:AcrR family transcriptional regulator